MSYQEVQMVQILPCCQQVQQVPVVLVLLQVLVPLEVQPLHEVQVGHSLQVIHVLLEVQAVQMDQVLRFHLKAQVVLSLQVHPEDLLVPEVPGVLRCHEILEVLEVQVLHVLLVVQRVQVNL